jgi:hypothetical protein
MQTNGLMVNGLSPPEKAPIALFVTRIATVGFERGRTVS